MPLQPQKHEEDADESEQGCFEPIYCNVLSEPHGDNTNSMADCIREYIKLCRDNTHPTRTV